MIDLPNTFDSTNTEFEGGGGDFSMLPPGQYIAQAIEAKRLEADETDPKWYTHFSLNVTFEIIDGQFSSRKLWHVFRLVHPNPTTAKIGDEQLRRFTQAAGVTQKISNLEPVMLKPVKLTVKAIPAGTTKGNYTYEKDRNEISGFSAATTQGFAPPPMQQPAQRPAMPSGASQGMPQPTPAPQASKPGVPSWLTRK